MKILELYSGIGGMHMAFTESRVEGEVKAAIEINNVANQIYKHNFPETNLLNLNIEGLTVKIIEKLDVDTILMSPPCQPFSRNGNQNDVNDHRTDSFRHILNLLPKLINIKNLLIENVKGFEVSEMRNILINALVECNYHYQEFILSPSQFNIPNCRHRYYCLAKKEAFKFPTTSLMEQLPLNIPSDSIYAKIEDILDKDEDYENYCLPDNVLKKRLNVVDICYSESEMSCCFTKAYGRYIEGTGSIFTELKEQDVIKKLQILKTFRGNDETYLKIARSLKLRFFTPTEIAKLMCFPKYFSFPSYITKKQKYMLLGNSINVTVVSYLIKLLAAYFVI
ncbi:tRNA (cytosine(38)-C(5))-methyltransferase [Rhynchophorus ferrugineus]|uniref:tRNA (cytosine(38)-C(5))-methyltransferase n=1 Tax=Rhynchophorus ferrugineus TaxID=354439 RepID=UPI003FCDEBFF